MARSEHSRWLTAVDKEIIGKLDVEKIYVSLGVRMAGSAKDNGWVDCYRHGSDESNASAGINIRTGRYNEFGGNGKESESLFDFVARTQGGKTRTMVRREYAEMLGVSLDRSEPAKVSINATPEENSHLALMRSWCAKKLGIDECTARYAGAAIGTYGRFNLIQTVITFPVFWPDGSECGRVQYAVTGLKLKKWMKGKEPSEKKVLLANDSKKGWIGKWGVSLIAEKKAEAVLIFEGATDALAAQSACSRTGYLKRHAIVAKSHGAISRPDPAQLKCLAGKVVYIFADADKPGRIGAVRWAKEIAKMAREVRIVYLPYSETESHGKDARDFLNEHDGDYLALLALTEAAEIFKPDGTAAPATVVPGPASGAAVSGATVVGEVRDADVALSLDIPEGQTDLANGRRLAKQHADDLRYCHAFKKWFEWDGRRWSIDATAGVRRRANAVVDAMFTEARESSDDSDSLRKKLKFVMRSADTKSISAMLTAASSLSVFSILPSEFDTHQYLWNCVNGTLDVRTGILSPHCREHLITKLCQVPYVPSAAAPRWLEFLNTTFASNDDVIGYMQRLLGYCLTGDVSEQILPIFWGSGANGKSTLLNAIFDVMGADYAMKAASDFIMAKKGDSHPTDKMDLFGKRFVAAVETEDGRRLSESLVKELTGGDAIRGRRMREDQWEYFPTHKLTLTTNHKPTIRGTDGGIWRRLKLIPFTATIPDEKRDRHLSRALRGELEGILAWLVVGAVEWSKRGLCEPGEIKAASEEYRGSQDVLQTFIEQCCITGAAFRCRASDILAAFQSWSGIQISQRQFGTLLTEKGFERARSDGVWYIGIAVLPSEITFADRKSEPSERSEPDLGIGSNMRLREGLIGKIGSEGSDRSDRHFQRDNQLVESGTV